MSWLKINIRYKTVFTVFLLGICGPNLAFGMGNQCKNIFSQNAAIAENDIWDSDVLGNPMYHDENNFIYVVHATNNLQRFEGELNIGEQMPIIFASAVSPEKTGSFYNKTGVILGIKPDHVFVTHIGDSATQVVMPMDFNYRRPQTPAEAQIALNFYTSLEHGSKKISYSPHRLIEATKSSNGNASGHNEIILAGINSENEPIKVIGFYSTVNPEGQAFFPDSFNEAKKMATKTNLPFIVIHSK